MRQLNISTLFTLKYPLQNQYSTRVCHIDRMSSIFSQIVLFQYF